MKKIIANIRRSFTRHTYNATMVIAGHTITVPITAADNAAAARQADILVDDCGFVIDITRV